MERSSRTRGTGGAGAPARRRAKYLPVTAAPRRRNPLCHRPAQRIPGPSQTSFHETSILDGGRGPRPLGTSSGALFDARRPPFGRQDERKPNYIHGWRVFRRRCCPGSGAARQGLRGVHNGLCPGSRSSWTGRGVRLRTPRPLSVADDEWWPLVSVRPCRVCQFGFVEDRVPTHTHTRAHT